MTDINAYKPIGFKPKTNEKVDYLSLGLKGIILGDIAGSKYESSPSTVPNANTIDLLGNGHYFTDDSIMTLAVYEAVRYIKKHPFMTEKKKIKIYRDSYLKYGEIYPDAGYGSSFYEWLNDSKHKPYNSFGNGAAMRAGIIGIMLPKLNDVIKHAYYSAMPTHNHPEGIKGAIVTAVATWMMCKGANKDDIHNYITQMYPENNYIINGNMTLQDLMSKPYDTISVYCQRSVPEAFINLIYSKSYEDFIRNAFRYWCDRDTICAIAGGAAAIMHQDVSLTGFTEEQYMEYFPKEALNVLQ